MSRHNFEDMIHIIKKINFFLGMCMEDIDHTNYDADARMLLKFAINAEGVIFLNKLMDVISLAEKVSSIKNGDDGWKPSKDLVENVQEEWDKRFKNVGKTKPKTENLFSEGQEDQENVEKDEQDLRDDKGPQGGTPRT